MLRPIAKAEFLILMAGKQESVAVETGQQSPDLGALVAITETGTALKFHAAQPSTASLEWANLGEGVFFTREMETAENTVEPPLRIVTNLKGALL